MQAAKDFKRNLVFAVPVLFLVVCAASTASANQGPRRSWTSLDLSDVDPSPYRWNGLCQVKETIGRPGSFSCAVQLLPPASGGSVIELVIQWSESGPASECADGQFRSRPSGAFEGHWGWALGSTRRSVGSIALGGNSDSINEDPILARILPDLVRRVEPYALRCSGSSEAPATTRTPPSAGTPPSSTATPLDIPEFDAGAEGADAEGGVFGQPDPVVDPPPPTTPAPEINVTFGDGLEALDAGDFAASFELMREAADLGHPRAPGYVGDSYFLGRGTEKNGEQALHYYRLGAERNDPGAKHQLGRAWELGRFGLEPDWPKALALYRQGAEQGHALSTRSVGWAYQQGLGGVAQDDAAALEYYVRAAEQGDIDALNDAGIFYREGRGVPPQPELAVSYFRRGAAAGDPFAMHSLARAYRFGIGVAADREQARSWYQKAKDLGNQRAIEALDKLAAGEW